MAKNKNDRIEVPELDYFSERFDFISNETLKSNLSISFQYIVFLIKIETDFQTTGAVEYSIFKNIIQYTASIVEGVMHYGLEKAIAVGAVEEKSVMPKVETYKDRKLIYKADDEIEILAVTKVQKHEKYKKNTQFKTICDAYKKGKLIDGSLINEVNDLREKRNRIHLAGLTKIENYYIKDDIDNAFSTAQKVIEAVKSFEHN